MLIVCTRSNIQTNHYNNETLWKLSPQPLLNYKLKWFHFLSKSFEICFVMVITFDLQKVATSVQISMNYLFQAYGALVLSSIFISWYAPCFLRREDRRSFFVSNLLVCIVHLIKTLFQIFLDQKRGYHFMLNVFSKFKYLY